jgi:hypothetical protein
LSDNGNSAPKKVGGSGGSAVGTCRIPWLALPQVHQSCHRHCLRGDGCPLQGPDGWRPTKASDERIIHVCQRSCRGRPLDGAGAWDEDAIAKVVRTQPATKLIARRFAPARHSALATRTLSRRCHFARLPKPATREVAIVRPSVTLHTERPKAAAANPFPSMR